MATVEIEDIDLFRFADQIPDPLWQDVIDRPAEQAAASCEAGWDGQHFSLPLVGRQYLVDAKARSITEEARPDYRVSYQTGLVLLTALAGAQDIPPSGRMATPQELPGGRFFFVAGPHEVPCAPIVERFGHDPKALVDRARALGGDEWEGAEAVDAAITLAGLPRLPMYVMLWAANDEFSARAVIGVDDRAHYQLALDGVLALCNTLTHRLCGGGQ